MAKGNVRRLALLLPVGLLLLGALGGTGTQAAGIHTQELTLQPGWNAIYLEVQPEPSDVAGAFATGCVAGCDGSGGVPIASVWAWDPRFGGKVEDVPDPERGLIEVTGWFGFFPAWREEALLTNLFHLRVNRSYLVKIAGTQPVIWQVPGQPSLRRQRWEPDSFNLVGFPVDPQSPPSFGSWFEPSPAHAGQPIYRLDPVGVWQPVLPYLEPIRSGVAYWVWTRGVSEYQGPMDVELDLFDRLEFGAARERSTLQVHNYQDINTSMTLRKLPSALPVPLKYESAQADSPATEWPRLPDTLSFSVPAGETLLLTLAPSRGDFPDRVAQVLEIKNGLGSRRLILVGANTTQSTTPDSFEPSDGGARATSAHSLAGLWVGTATVRAVQELRCIPVDPRCVGGEDDGDICNPDAATPCPGDAQAEPPIDEGACRLIGTCEDGAADGDACDTERGDSDCPDGSCVYCTPVDLAEPTAAGTGFDLRLIVHVSADGDACLLKEVIQMFEAPVYGPDPDTPDYQTIVDPGEFVLITDDARIPSFTGVAMRDGVAVGVRVATVAYDFDGTSCGTPGLTSCSYDADDCKKGLKLFGTFGDTLDVDFALGRDFPTNPYRHPYHPDHDNNDPAQRPADLVHPPEIVRAMNLDFEPRWGRCTGSGLSCDCTAECDFACATGEQCETELIEARIPAPPDWGADTLGGIYGETIRGMHDDDIEVRGTFLLNRVVATAELNP